MKKVLIASTIVLISAALILSFVLARSRTPYGEFTLDSRVTISEVEDLLVERQLQDKEIVINVNDDPTHPVGWFGNRKTNEQFSGFSYDVTGDTIFLSIYIKPDTFTEEELLLEVNKNYIRALFNAAEPRKATQDYSEANELSMDVFLNLVNTESIMPVMKKE